MNYRINVNKWIKSRDLSIINDYLLGIENRKFDFSREMICEKYNLTINDLDTFLENNLSVMIMSKKCKKCKTNYHTSFVKRRDILNNLERVSDHCSNIAVDVIQSDKENFDTHEYLDAMKNRDNQQFAREYKEYKEKYRLPETRKFV